MSRVTSEEKKSPPSKPAGFAEMVEVLQLIKRGLANNSISSKLIVQFTPPGSKRCKAKIVALESMVSKALKKAGVK